MLRSHRRWVRITSAVGIILGTLVGLVVLARIVLPSGYGNAQDYGACRLAENSKNVLTFRTGTLHDLFIYIPAYTLWLLALVNVTSPVRLRDRWSSRWKDHLLSDGVLTVLLLAAAIADVGETTLFRRTLGALQQGHACHTLTSATNLTKACTGAKFGLALLCAIGITARIVQRPSPSRITS